jgi:hypothetical protein
MSYSPSTTGTTLYVRCDTTRCIRWILSSVMKGVCGVNGSCAKLLVRLLLSLCAIQLSSTTLIWHTPRGL